MGNCNLYFIKIHYDMSHSISKVVHRQTTDSDEIFLKGFLRNFYKKIIVINTNDFNTFENDLSKWIKNIDKNTKPILELMQNHKENEFWFSNIIGFFYQNGISCEVDKDKSLELYLL